MNAKKVGEFLFELRKENQLTQEQLAEKLGVSNRSVSRWENGTTMPDLPMLLRICREFNVSISELIRAERKDTDSDMDKNIPVILQLADRDKEQKAKKVNGFFALGALFLCGIILYDLARLTGAAAFPALSAGKIGILFVLGLLFEFAGFYCNTKGSKTKTFTEKELNTLTMDEADLRMRETEEMLQAARKYQKAELKQFRKAFQEIAGSLQTDEYAVFSMVADTYTYDDSPGPWHIALAVTNQRLLLCGEAVRGRMFTGYSMDAFNRDQVRSASLVGRKIVIKAAKDTIKIERENLAAVIDRLKSALEACGGKSL